jgi:glycosyltransferase involved in cell wall biosynthesis
MTSISAYIPTYNNAPTIERALQSIKNQTVSIEQVFVIDDHSDDDSVAIAEAMAIPVIKQASHLGRGAVRNQAMLNATNELVLCLDAGKVLAPDFVEKALPWFEDPKVAAVFGKIQQAHVETLAERWAFRHIYRTDMQQDVSHHVVLITGAAIVRKSQLLAVGNFNQKSRYGEDAELSMRLLAAGCDIVLDPKLSVQSIIRDRLADTLERYWRWNSALAKEITINDYIKQMVYSIKVMALADVKAGDPASAILSLFSAHYRFWRSVFADRV